MWSFGKLVAITDPSRLVVYLILMGRFKCPSVTWPSMLSDTRLFGYSFACSLQLRSIG